MTRRLERPSAHLCTTKDANAVLGAGLGGKSEGLAKLLLLGARVPDTLFIKWPGSDVASKVDLLEAVVEACEAHMVSVKDLPRLIIRSSHSREDAEGGSEAGLHESSVVSIEGSEGVLKDAFRRVIHGHTVAHKEGGMENLSALIVQRHIQAKIGGVLFTTNPLEGHRNEGLVSYVNGPCSGLVDGSLEPQNVSFSRLKPADLTNCPDKLQRVWQDLVSVAWRLEDQWQRPLDLEFVIDDHGDLFFVQARPVASLTRWRSQGPIEVQESAPLPPSAVTHAKVALRFRCQTAGVAISPAWLVTLASWARLSKTPLPISEYTAVCIVPRLVDGEVLRVFSRDGWTAIDLIGRATEDYWVRHIFVSELWPSYVTGMAMRQVDHLLIEFARGHFIPKGLGPTNVVTIKDGEVAYIRKTSCLQFYDVDFLTGQPVLRTALSPLEMEADTLREVADVCARLGLGSTECLEFGVTSDGMVFVIDTQEVAGASSISPDGMSVSAGTASGELVYVEIEGTSGSEHLHAAASQYTQAEGRPVIVSADRPALELIHRFTHLAGAGQRVVGVIFEEYSPLAHLSLLLREWGIPAVSVRGFRKRQWPEGTKVLVQAGEGGCVVNELE